MAKYLLGENGTKPASPYSIYGKPGHFTVNFTSPYNSTHQISGFKSEDDAQAWIEETRSLVKKYG